MQTSIHRALIVIAVLLGFIAIGLFTQRGRTQGVTTPPSPLGPAQVGRYQFVVEDGHVENIFDTQTGRIWWHDAGNASTQDLKVWHEEDPPQTLKLPTH